MEFCALASGSTGNSILIRTENTSILIDAGLSGKKTAEALSSIGTDVEDIKAIFITHEHTDHIKGAAILARKYGIPLYATHRTLAAIYEGDCCRLPKPLMRIVEADSSVEVGDITVTPYSVTHDAVDPVGYTVSGDGRKIGFATDLGEYNEYILGRLDGSDALYVEANHNINMLMAGTYPYQTKVRINSPLGHLSNEACGEMVVRLQHPGLHTVVLAHISLENNFDELAYKTVEGFINEGWRQDKKPRLVVAGHYQPTGILKV